MKISDLKLKQPVVISKKDYTYEGIQKVRGKIGIVQKIVFQGKDRDDQVLYDLNQSSLTLENENILIGKII